MPTDLTTPLLAMNDGLNAPPAEVDRTSLLPLLAPAAFFSSGKWCGPSVRLRNPDIGLTWVVRKPGQTMRCLNFEIQKRWEAEGLDWKELAMRNLSACTTGQAGVFELRRPNGELYAISFMFQDGLGPSRLLFRGSLTQMFPDGYRVAIPERSCGIAFAANLAGKEMRSLQSVIDNCYKKGTRRFVPGSYDADALLPE
jgi:hypothetical protein